MLLCPQTRPEFFLLIKYGKVHTRNNTNKTKGTLYFQSVTLVATLQREAGGMLAMLCSGLFALEEDSEGYIFIDRDFTQFGAVLAYLREGAIARRIVDMGNIVQLQRELQYYGLSNVAKLPFPFFLTYVYAMHPLRTPDSFSTCLYLFINCLF